MSRERRKDERLRGDLTARWEGVLARQDGVLVDISSSGCFILTRDDVRINELVRLEIDCPARQIVYLWGEVVYKIPEMGFAVRFTGTDRRETQSLKLLLESLRRRPRTRRPRRTSTAPRSLKPARA
jgi:hypothetical protein